MKMALIALFVLALALAALTVRRLRLRSRTGPVERPPREKGQPSRTAAELWGSLATVERETGFFGRWNETRFKGHRVAFRQEGACLMIYGGDFDSAREQVVEVTLVRTENSAASPRIPAKRRLGRHVGPEGKALAMTYHLPATASGELSLLAEAEIRTALLGFSDHVKAVGFYESGGVFIKLELTRAMRGFDADMHWLIRLVKAHEEAISASLA